MSLALTRYGQGPHRRVREPGAWGPAPPPYLFADSRVLERRRLMAPSLCKSGDGRCFVLRLPGVMTRRPCGAQLHDDEALFSLGARGALARCGLAATRRQPTGAPWGPAGGHRLCARYLPRVSDCALCTLRRFALGWFAFVVCAYLVLQWCQWEWGVGSGQPSVGCRCYVYLRYRRTTSTGCYEWEATGLIMYALLLP